MCGSSPEQDAFGLRIVRAAWRHWEIQPWMGGYTATLKGFPTPVLHFETTLPAIAEEIGNAERQMALHRHRLAGQCPPSPVRR